MYILMKQQKLGANRLCDIGLGDDQHEDKYDTAFEEVSKFI